MISSPHEEGDITNKTDTDVLVFNRTDVYQLYTPYQRQMILISGAMVAMMTPFCDTVYLPALKDVALELNTTDRLTSISVSAYLAAVGVSQLVLGPLSDYYGRLIVLFSCLIIFEAFTIGCIFAQDINTLIALRTIQGFFVGSCIVSVQAIIADVFAPEERGAALSYFLAPMLIGPVIAPLIGGILAETFSWRADFVLLAVMIVPIFIFTYIYNPETLHWLLLKKRIAGHLSLRALEMEQKAKNRGQGVQLSECNGSKTIDTDATVKYANFEVQQLEFKNIEEYFSNATTKSDIEQPNAQQIKEMKIDIKIVSKDTCIDSEIDHYSSSEINLILREKKRENSDENNYERNGIIESKERVVTDISKPTMMMPWTVLAFLFDLELTAYYLTVGITFACMFTSLTLLPIYLSQPPYELSAGIVGVTFLPVGIAMLIGALVGGSLSDWSGMKYSHVADGKMVVCLLVCWACPLGTVGFGFSLQNKQPLYAVLLTHCIVGFAQAILMPSTLAFITTIRPDNSGAAGSVLLFGCFALSAISISVSTIIADLIGVGYFFLALSALASLVLSLSTFICIYKIFYQKIE